VCRLCPDCTAGVVLDYSVVLDEVAPRGDVHGFEKSVTNEVAVCWERREDLRVGWKTECYLGLALRTPQLSCGFGFLHEQMTLYTFKKAFYTNKKAIGLSRVL
jgi:hypothetical protein